VIGLIMMLLTLALAFAGAVGPQHAYRVRTLALYWHFVDAVWVVVFTVVYVVGR
jgi:cytochrome c oxidase subunit 3/cytochrome o ubiquinol oxidase subunit 3